MWLNNRQLHIDLKDHQYVIIQLAQNSEEWHTTDEAGFLWKARVVMTDPLSEYRANGPSGGVSLTLGYYVMPVTVMQHCKFKHTLGISCNEMESCWQQFAELVILCRTEYR